MWRHGYTYSGHAAAAAAALANLDIMEREDLLARAIDLEAILSEALGPLAKHDLVSEVRSGVGVLAAVQLDPEAANADPTLLARVVPALRANGIMTQDARSAGRSRSRPRWSSRDDEVEELAAGVGAALDDLG